MKNNLFIFDSYALVIFAELQGILSIQQQMDIKIKKLSRHDNAEFISLIKVFEEVFEMKDFSMPDEKYLQQVLAKDDFFVFVALHENEVVGGLTSYILHQYYSTQPLVYIYDLAVKIEFQRQGIGKRLIACNNNYCKDINVEVVMVQADEVDAYAIDFYRSTGGTGEKVIHFDYKL